MAAHLAAYYNENDKFAAEWLRNLIAKNLIAPGDVDTRSIVDVKPDDLIGYEQCHFFAGIGGWSLAARLAGWDDDRAIWTGSCPCQPFSCAGRGKGIADERHLWPDFYRLISGSRPAVVVGEQVAGKAGYAWLDRALSDLEAEAYTGRAVDIPACSVNTPHIRNRLYWLADTDTPRQHGLPKRTGTKLPRAGTASGISGWLGDSHQPRPQGWGDHASERTSGAAGSWGMGNPEELHGNVSGDNAGRSREGDREVPESGDSGGTGELADAVYDGRRARPASQSRCESGAALTRNGGRDGFWDDWTVVGPDPEGKYRRVKPGIRLLANGVPSRVGKLRGGGNAIVPELAAEVIRAYMDTQ